MFVFKEAELHTKTMGGIKEGIELLCKWRFNQIYKHISFLKFNRKKLYLGGFLFS